MANKHYEASLGIYNPLEHGVVQGALASDSARQTNLDYLNAAIVAAATARRRFWMPPGDYDLYGVGGVIIDQDWFKWEGSMDVRLFQHKLDEPVLHIGSPLGTTGTTCEGVEFNGAYLRYDGQSTLNAGQANTGALQMNGVYMCDIRNLQIGDVNAAGSSTASVPWCGVYCDQVSGTTPIFSNHFSNIRIKNFRKHGWSQYRNDFAAATGNVWNNLYISSGSGASPRDISANGGMPLYMGACATNVWNQLNIEWSTAEVAAYFEVSRDIVINSLNVEGITLKKTGSGNESGLMHFYQSSGVVNAAVFNNCTFNTANGLGNTSIYRSYESNLILRSQRPMLSAKTVSSHVFARMQTGAANSNYALSGLSLGDTDVLTAIGDTNANNIFSSLDDFNNNIPVLAANANYVQYAYKTPGVIQMTPTAARNIDLMTAVSATNSTIIPRGARRTVRKLAGSTFVVTVRSNTTAISGGTLTTADQARDFVFDGTNWVSA